MRIGILHPGTMGSALAANIGANVQWVGDGRSAATRERASALGIDDAGSLANLVARADVIISVCPPHAARDVARSVAAHGFDGLYVDANAVSPATVTEIAGLFPRFVDGSIIGPPPVPDGSRTRIYLSGDETGIVVSLFQDSHVEVLVVGDEPGSASAIKIAYAGWTKGSAGLLLAVASYARSQGVLAPLVSEWERSIPGLAGRLDQVSSGVGAKAWRFAGEMGEVAASLDRAGLPDGFHLAAADIYSRLADLKDGSGRETLDEILARLMPR